MSETRVPGEYTDPERLALERQEAARQRDAQAQLALRTGAGYVDPEVNQMMTEPMDESKNNGRQCRRSHR